MTSLATAFDTHKFIKQMVATGFTEEQAETQVQLLSEILDYQLSTKADVGKVDANVQEIRRDIKELDVKIESIKAELKRDIKELDVKMETRSKEQELRMVIKTGAMILGGIGLLFGLMRAWPIPVQYVPPLAPMRLSAPAAPITPPAPPVASPSR